MSSTHSGIDSLRQALAERLQQPREDPVPWILGLDERARTSLAKLVDEHIQARPTPIGDHADSPEGRLLERIAAWSAFLTDGDFLRALAAERTAWLRGGDRLTYLQRMARLGDESRAFALARSMLANANAAERARIEDFLRGDDLLPVGFEESVIALPRDASREDIEHVLRFVPDPVRQRALHRIGEALVDAAPGLLFEIACWDGPTSDAIAMVESGVVPPADVVRVADARELDPTGRSLWLGLAARAAAARGDHLGVVRLLREAVAGSGEDPWLDLESIWIGATPALRELMVSAGLPVGQFE